MSAHLNSRLERLKKRRSRLGRYLLLGVAAVFIVMLGVASGVVAFLWGLQDNPADWGMTGEGVIAGSPITDPLREGERVNVLIIGMDKLAEGYKWARTDTIIVASFDPETEDVALVSIPRDTRVVVGDSGYDKINAAFAKGGPELAVSTVQRFLDIPIHYYVWVRIEGFAELVDIIGGVEIDVPQDMDYEDPTQDLYIHLKAGRQLLDGDKAMQFVRFRGYDDADLGRIRSQQEFIMAVAQKLKNPLMLLKLPELIRQAASLVRTNMPVQSMVEYGLRFADIDLGKIEMATVSGESRGPASGYSQWYYIHDEYATKQLVDEALRGIDRDINANITVEVLNGCGEAGLATAVAEHLMGEGFRVVTIGDAEQSNYQTSGVVSRTGNRDSLRRMGQALMRLSDTISPRYFEDIVEQPEAEITIVLGADMLDALEGK